ncbi:Putative dehydrogenase [Lactobacillus plantarum ZJ316] [Lactiplantibacillus plantarum]|uniref:Aldo-keto reductase n=1 Tax=Lactiplantibacillus plantarum CMPG5300 TaxID=1304889 RepID=A0AAW3FL17_LACPN|nr:aldo/keto reductase [Lactiplantibacillus plantarum]ANM74371.1 aldehyde oxidase [Lactiplantibacillus plantarum]ARW36546.1 Pyridoxine 4-dehydrogenase [Lactiplantibacillus plantarum]ATI72349.1 aldo/keto reductase [Lactiplantibacillus plantarum]KGH41794.1 Aldo-keto reductase [Lactiplantibacillus plantarum CMPG5300]KZU07495.1 Aldo-keto reductase [Lactiplantibacillus plantarum]
MVKRTLGTASPLTVDAIGLGCMGMSYAYGKPKNEVEMVQLLRKAVELGETTFDTAEVYGPFTNELLLGKAFKGYHDRITIATKGGIKVVDGKQVVDGNLRGLVDSVEGSLKRLQLDTIDMYYLHRVDPKVPIEEIAETMGQLIKAGKIKHWGLSEASVQTIRKANAIQPLTAVESEYSLWTREPEKELIPTLKKLGIGLVPFSPLGKGFLTGKIDANTTFDKNDGRNRLPRFQKDAMEANMALVRLLQQVAESKKATPAQVALAWLLAQQPWIVPIPGTTKLSRLQENMGAEKIVFSPAEMKNITAAADQVQIMGNRYIPELAKRAGL